MLLLVAAIAVPAILASATIAWFSYRTERRNAETQLLATSRALALVVDRQLGQAEAVLWALSASPILKDRNFPAFHRLAREAVRSPDAWIAVSDREGRQLVNTRLPYGTDLLRDPETVPRWNRLHQDRALVSLYIGPSLGDWVVGLEVPVVHEGKTIFILAFRCLPDAFQRILVQQGLPRTWIGAILDSDARVVARSRNARRFVGRYATPDVRERLAVTTRGVSQSVSLDGVKTVVAYSRSPVYGWAVVLAVPRDEISATVRRSMIWVSVLAVGLLLTGLVLGTATARLITVPFQSLRRAAQDAGQGTLTEPPKTGLQEADAVGAALYGAVLHLQTREDRQRLLAAELSHRVKNVLAVVQSIALQTTARSKTLEDFNTSFQGRLMALARAHSLALQHDWTEVDLRSLAAQELTPFEGLFHITGERLIIPAKQSVGLALILHELATNASRYGAFSRPDGHVHLGWRVDRTDDGHMVTLVWKEDVRGPVTLGAEGFGSRLIRAAVKADLQGTAELCLTHHGLEWVLRFPLRNPPLPPNRSGDPRA